jgi:hypothetical protein
MYQISVEMDGMIIGRCKAHVSVWQLAMNHVG